MKPMHLHVRGLGSSFEFKIWLGLCTLLLHMTPHSVHFLPLFNGP